MAVQLEREQVWLVWRGWQEEGFSLQKERGSNLCAISLLQEMSDICRVFVFGLIY